MNDSPVLRHAVRAVAAGEQVPALAPRAEVDVAAVAHLAGHHHRRERRPPAVAHRHAADRLANQDRQVGRRDRRSRAGSETSSWPVEYSGWNWSTPTPCSSKATIRSRAEVRQLGQDVRAVAGPVMRRLERSAASSRPRKNSTSQPTCRSSPRRRPDRPCGAGTIAGTPGATSPSCVYWSAGAHAHPGCAESIRSAPGRASAAGRRPGPPTSRSR